jgi:hypothetical protein
MAKGTLLYPSLCLCFSFVLLVYISLESLLTLRSITFVCVPLPAECVLASTQWLPCDSGSHVQDVERRLEGQGSHPCFASYLL